MMKKISFLLLTILLSAPTWSQVTDQSILLIVNNDSISKADFLKVYTKNTQQDQVLYTQEALSDYLKLYINFRLKVQAAEDAGYDTNVDLQNELAMYRSQLSQPYLLDTKVSENLIQEAYQHLQYDMHAAHILINLDKKASGADTVKAYKKAMEARAKILKGIDFAEVAEQYSDDPSARKSDRGAGNGGDLGYFTAFNMVYPFENAVYNLNVGEVSMPVRTDFGYHVIKLLNKNKALGKVRASHIIVMLPPNAPKDMDSVAKLKIDSAYTELQAGHPFAEVVAKYTDDKSSAKNGGKIPDFSINRMVPELVDVFYDLKPLDYTKPVRSRFGWHIIQFYSATGVPAFDSTKQEIEYRIMRDERAKLPQSTFVAKLKTNYNFKEEKNAFTVFSNLVSDSLLKGTWKFTPSSVYQKNLFSYAGKQVKYLDFANYILKKQKLNLSDSKQQILTSMYNSFVDNTLLEHESLLLDTKYPEFTALMQEYRDGVYLFDITNRKVWARASQDTVALLSYFELSKDKYKWPKKVEAKVFTYDVANLDTEKVAKFLSKSIKKKLNFAQLKTAAEKTFGKENFTLIQGRFEQGQNSIVDKAPQQLGLSKDILTGTTQKGFVIIDQMIPEQYQTLEEVRGLIIADFQKYLEEEWIKELQKKYSYSVNQDVFKSMLK
ncbi:MAG: peptidylprolyl isomerase [Bacteroidales bacterium]